MFQRICFFVIRKEFFRKIWEKLLDAAAKTGLESARTASKM